MDRCRVRHSVRNRPLRAHAVLTGARVIFERVIWTNALGRFPTEPGESNELDPEDAYLVIDNDPDPAELATEIAAFLVCQIENT